MREYKWEMGSLPPRGLFYKYICRMNRWGALPNPFERVGRYYKQRIKQLLPITRIDFGTNFYALYGNIYGDSLWCLDTYILDYAPVSFGHNVTIGPNVRIITSSHDPSNFRIVRAKEIVIGSNVWITMNAIVLPGVTIGDNTIIGAGAVVTKNIPANVIAAGNPAKPIKSRL